MMMLQCANRTSTDGTAARTTSRAPTATALRAGNAPATHWRARAWRRDRGPTSRANVARAIPTRTQQEAQSASCVRLTRRVRSAASSDSSSAYLREQGRCGAFEDGEHARLAGLDAMRKGAGWQSFSWRLDLDHIVGPLCEGCVHILACCARERMIPFDVRTMKGRLLGPRGTHV